MASPDIDLVPTNVWVRNECSLEPINVWHIAPEDIRTLCRRVRYNLNMKLWNRSLDSVLSSLPSLQWNTTTTAVIAVTATALLAVSWRRNPRQPHSCAKAETWETRVVRPHGPWKEIWPQTLYTLEAPGCSMGPPVRNMSVYRVPGEKRLVLYNGVSLSDAALTELLSWGTPSILVVPNGMHREDAAIWKQKFPSMIVVCPSSQKEKVEEVVAVDKTMEEWVAMEEWSKWVHAKEVDGWCKFELVLEVQLEHDRTKEGGKIAMMVCDLLFTMPYNFNFNWTDKFISWCFDSHIILPSDPKTMIVVPKVSRIARVFVIRDWKKAEQWYRTYAKEFGQSIAVILVGHGIPVVPVNPTDGCTQALEGVADQLTVKRW